MSKQYKELRAFDVQQARSNKQFYGRNILIGSNLEKFDTLKNMPIFYQKHSNDIQAIKRAYKPIKKLMMAKFDGYSNGRVY